jgi:hypothetical protein
MAATNGTHNVRVPAGKGASILQGIRHRDDDDNRIVIFGTSLEVLTQRFWTRFMSIPLNVESGNG